METSPLSGKVIVNGCLGLLICCNQETSYCRIEAIQGMGLKDRNESTIAYPGTMAHS